MDVSIIIVSYNTRDLTIQCLDSVFKQTKNIEFEVIVVDNNSIDGSKQAITKWFPQVLLIENNENEGFGRANNIGINYAKGKYLFLLNSDTILLNNVALIFFDFSESNQSLKIGALGAVLLDANKMMTRSSGIFPSKKAMLMHILIGYLQRKYYDKLKKKEISFYQDASLYLKVDNVSGADLFVLKATMNEMNGFDPFFFIYYEETDLQRRLKDKGFSNMLINGPSIVHLEGASLANLNNSNEQRLIFTKSMFYYFKKHSPMISFYLFKYLFLIIRFPTILDKRYTWIERKKYIIQIIKS
jgi:hypothetical protein